MSTPQPSSESLTIGSKLETSADFKVVTSLPNCPNGKLVNS